MKMKLSFIAALSAAGLLTSPATAQDSMTDIAKGELTIKADHVTETNTGEVTIKGDPITIESPGQVITVKDGEMIMGQDGKVTIMGDEIITAPKKASMLEIACPAGTTAQANGTCMITGEYKSE